MLVFVGIFVSAQLFFCLCAVDPHAKAWVYNEEKSQQKPEGISDPQFRFFSYGSLIWTLLLIYLLSHNKGRCSLLPSEFWSVDTALGIATVWMTAKILLGPLAEVRKSLLRTYNGDLVQPWSYKLYDLAIVYPMNF